MALTECPECQQKVSDKAATCPHCGAPVVISSKHSVPATTAVIFSNPATGEQLTILNAGLWTFLFGPFYFMLRGVWSHAAISLVVAIVTYGVSWLAYPFFAQGILRKHLISKGWIAIK